MNTKHIPLTLLLALLFSACAPKETPMLNPDIGAIQTAAAQTVMADIAATVAAQASLTALPSMTLEATQPSDETPTVTVTLTVGVFSTPGAIGTPLGLCDDASYDPLTVDVTVPDGTEVTPGQDFLKTWKIRNTGDCTWGAGYAVVYGGYIDRMSGVPAAIPTPVIPNQEVDVSVQFKAPTKVGEYLSAWRMANASGYTFGEFFFVRIIVR